MLLLFVRLSFLPRIAYCSSADLRKLERVASHRPPVSYTHLEQNERASRFLFDESASQPSYGRSSSNLSGGQKSFFVGERPKAEIIRPSVPRNLTKVGLATVSKPSAAGTLPVNVLAGQVIEHERFGIGDVIKVEGTGENSKATVRFRNAGEKQLLLKFARFKVVE